jgi:hypothetical protein
MLSEFARKGWRGHQKTIQRGQRIVYGAAKVVFCTIREADETTAGGDSSGKTDICALHVVT